MTDWEVAGVDVTHLQQTTPAPLPVGNFTTPTIYSGVFISPPSKPDQSFPQDSYISTPGWFKGQMWVNNFNLGRYWPAAGPQMTLYVPKTILRPFPFENNILMLEYERAPCVSSSSCVVQFTTTPVLNGSVHPDEYDLRLPLQNIRLHGHV